MKSESLILIVLSVFFLPLVIHAAEKPSAWTGRYRDIRGYDLVIDEWEPGELQVDIVKAGKPADNPEEEEAAFLATVKGDVATWSSIQECLMSLKRAREGVVVTDNCKGARDNTGFYKLVD